MCTADAALVYGYRGSNYPYNAYRNFNIGSISNTGCSVQGNLLYINGAYRRPLTRTEIRDLEYFQEQVALWSRALRENILMEVQRSLMGVGTSFRRATSIAFPRIPSFCYNY